MMKTHESMTDYLKLTEAQKMELAGLPSVPSNALLAEALTLLDRIYATWCSDNTGNDLVDALDPLMEGAKRFLEAHTANVKGEG